MKKRISPGVLARNVDHEMKRLHMAAQDVARATVDFPMFPIERCLDPSAVTRIANGEVSDPRVFTVAALGFVFGRSVDELIGNRPWVEREPPTRMNRRAPSRKKAG